MADSSLSLGKVAGISIELHFTFILLLLIAAFLGAGAFIFIVLLFVMVVLHELAHSITARLNGIPVKKIILLPLGGASIIDLDEVPPATSFRIALVGPLSSIALGFFFGMLAVYAPAGLLKVTLQLLFLLNILLGIFNLLPAFPLDGGRVLKSYLEKKRNQLEATKMAVKISNIMLVLLMVGTVLYVAILPNVSTTYIIVVVLINLIFIMFIYGGAQAELQSAYITKYTSNLHVYDALTRNYRVVSPNATMRQIYDILLKEKTHIILFKENGAIKLVRKPNLNPSPFSRASTQLLSKKVSEFGGTVLPKIEYGAPLSKAIEKMRYEESEVMAVVRRGKLAGILQVQHVESIIALHMQRYTKGNGEKEARQEPDVKL